MKTKTFRVIMNKTGEIETHISGVAGDVHGDVHGDDKVFYVLVDDNKIVDMKTNIVGLKSETRKEFTDAQIEAYMENLSLNKPIIHGKGLDNQTDSDLYDTDIDIGDSDAEDTHPTPKPSTTIRNLIEQALLNKFKDIGNSDAEDTHTNPESPTTIRNLIKQALMNEFRK